ncbi:nickel-dependent lactate racemase [uncultured Desulfuromusa sp.]|uniref:nickel-dependent lactate racemase n=1 Tax=uncultured Desulfuromusa sp. TaxID=219183 RepID=UPI002AA6D37D|nr:nickel-dependent lactate racemase [uncultured Desulfuromusa sp.]
MTKIELKYGPRVFSCSLCDARILQSEVLPEPPDAEGLIRKALAHPIGTSSLGEILTPGEKVAVVTSDITRYSGSEVFLPILVEELNALGIADADIEIIIALGIHRKQTEEEHRKIVGSLYGRVAVYDHECEDPAELIDLGFTDSGIPVQVNRRVVEADRVIVTGTIGFHYFAGFGGGRKGLIPGVASRETCMASHFAVFNPPEIGGKHPKAVTGVLDGNPVHRNLLQAARLVQPDFLLNTVLSPQKKILGVFCGDLEQAHLAGCDMVRELFQVALDKPFDLAVISCGGEPKDINFIQAQKALDYGCQAVKEGGTIILLAACRDGFGHSTFYDWFRYQDLDEFEAALRANYQINGQTAHATLTKARRYRVILISELTAEQTGKMGMEKAVDLDSALQMVSLDLANKAKVVIIPDGGMVLPVIEKND